MMKMSGRVVSCCVALFLALTSVSAVQRLNSINDLKRINFGQSVPKHSLVLLHWFANTVDIGNDDVIRLTFDPNREDYGSHHYGNYDGLLDELPQGRYRYYTVGNLNPDIPVPLPQYVIRPPTGFGGTNLDRIIFRVREHNTGWQALQTIDQVYITQHYELSYAETRYDPDHTYQITTNLLRQIREFSVEGNLWNSLSRLRDHYGSNVDDFQLSHLTNTLGTLVCLGLLLFIVTQDKQLSNQPSYRLQHEARRNIQPNYYVTPERQNNDCESLLISLVLFFVIVLVLALAFFSSFFNR